MGLYTNLTFPKDESAVDKWLLVNKDAIIAELKDYYEGCLDNCGADDEANTIPAKELYEKASLDILSCKEELEALFAEMEYWEKFIEEETERMEKEKALKERFKIVK